MKNYLFLLLLLLSFNYSFGQVNVSDDSLVVVTLTNGEIRIGKLISDDGREILLESKEIGKIYIRKENIKSIAAYNPKEFQNVGGELRAAGPFTTRYCFTTNSLPIKKGENYALVNLYGPEVHFSLSDRFSLGIMATWIASPMVLAAKYTIPTKNEKLNFGLGTLFGTSGYLNTFRGFGGLHWGMVTYGDRMNNITFSAGYSYIDLGFNSNYATKFQPGTYPAIDGGGYYYFATPPYQEIELKRGLSSAPAFGLSGIAKVGKKASFIFDAMVFIGKTKSSSFIQNVEYFYDPGTGQPSYTLVSEGTLTENQATRSTLAFFMPAMRFQTKDNRAFQVALAGALYKSEDETRAFPLPMVSWFFKF
jgi:hypothetical protein